MRAFLGLGVNLGDRIGQLRLAVAALRELLGEVECSPIYESVALLPEDALATWNMPFLNMVITGETTLSAPELLAAIKHCEETLGRQVRGHWGPREIDIDILAYGDMVVSQSDLIIPHAGLLLRDFALIPLADIEPSWQYPVQDEYYGMTAKALASRLHSTIQKTELKI